MNVSYFRASLKKLYYKGETTCLNYFSVLPLRRHPRVTACSAVTVTTDFDPRRHLINTEPTHSCNPTKNHRFHLPAKLHFVMHYTAILLRVFREVADNADLHVLRHVSTEEKLVAISD